MQYLRYFLLGLLCAGVVAGAWWLVLSAGLGALVVRRSYLVLSIGVVVDLWFAVVSAETLFYTGFFTLIFVAATLVVEGVRDRLFWAS